MPYFVTPVLSFSLISHFLLFCFSRGANYVTQVLLRPGASDLTGSFRYGFITTISEAVRWWAISAKETEQATIL